MSNVMRKVDLTVVNATRAATYLTNGVSSGPALLASGMTLQGYAGKPFSKSLSGSSNQEAVSGTLVLQNGDAGVTLLTATYCASSHSDQTALGVSTSNAYIGMVSQYTKTDNTLAGTITLYDGVAQPKSGVSVLSLDSDPMAIASVAPTVFSDLITVMFQPWVRSSATIASIASGASSAIKDVFPVPATGPVVRYADFTGGQIATLVNMWAGYWMTADAAKCPVPDARLIDVLKGFLAQTDTPPTLWIPQISYVGFMNPATQAPATSGAAQFTLEGYGALNFYLPVTDAVPKGSWDPASVTAFLTLLASGGHMVSICASQDNGGSYAGHCDFYAYFKGRNDIVYHEDQGCSHYAPSLAFNSSGSYYIQITSDDTPEQVVYDPAEPATWLGTLVAFMTGKTSQYAADGSGDYNAFFQLEGWQAHFGGTGGGVKGGKRHNGDYQAYDDSLWNISTFGCSPYSEKRATTVFLAPAGWVPEVTTITCMMPYVGARATSDGKAQHWVSTYLVALPADATPYDGNIYYYGAD